MKAKLLLMAILASLTIEASGQSFLEKLGKEVGKAVHKEVVKNIKKQKKGAGQQHQATQYNQEAEDDLAELKARDAAERAERERQRLLAATPDPETNITRDSSQDYIDEYGINHGGGILIDSIVWAPVNCGYHETKYPYGKLYQWGRKLGQGYGTPFAKNADSTLTDNVVVELRPAPVTPAEARKPQNENVFYAHSDYASFNWTRNDMWLWIQTCFIGDKPQKVVANDPCPEGWRVPDVPEVEKLGQNYSDWTVNKDGQVGRWLSGSQKYSYDVPRIFLPAAGNRNPHGTSVGRHKWGAYWTSRHHGSELSVGYFLVEDDEVGHISSGHPMEGQSVRCVKE